MKQMRILLTLAVLIVAAGFVAADSQWSQISWFVAETVAHTVSYGIFNSSIACSQTALFYVEPAPVNGVATKLNASTDQTGVYACQNQTQGAIRISNTGSVPINVTAGFNQITTGVKMKIAKGPNSWEAPCTGICDSGSCNLTVNCIQLSTGPAQIEYNMPQNSSQQYWLYADFNGVAGTVSPTKGNMTTTAVIV